MFDILDSVSFLEQRYCLCMYTINIIPHEVAVRIIRACIIKYKSNIEALIEPSSLILCLKKKIPPMIQSTKEKIHPIK